MFPVSGVPDPGVAVVTPPEGVCALVELFGLGGLVCDWASADGDKPAASMGATTRAQAIEKRLIRNFLFQQASRRNCCNPTRGNCNRSTGS